MLKCLTRAPPQRSFFSTFCSSFQPSSSTSASTSAPLLAFCAPSIILSPSTITLLNPTYAQGLIIAACHTSDHERESFWLFSFLGKKATKSQRNRSTPLREHICAHSTHRRHRMSVRSAAAFDHLHTRFIFRSSNSDSSIDTTDLSES